MRCAAFMLLPALLLAQNINEAEKRLKQEMERTKQIFGRVLARLEARRERLLARLKSLDEQAERLRRQLDQKASLLRQLTQQKRKLQQKVEQKEKEIEELQRRLPQVWAALQEASKAVFPVSLATPKRKDLKTLLETLQKLWQAGTQAKLTQEKVICRDGVVREARVLRLGRIARLWVTGDGRAGLGAVSPESPLRWEDVEADGALAEQIRNLFGSLEKGVELLWFPVDASKRVTARGLIERVGFWEQLRRGGVVMIPIGVVGIVGLILCVIVGLRLGGKNLKAEIENSAAARLRRRLLGFKDAGSAKLHEVLTEAVEEELVRFERGLGAVGVCAAVAPLLGLLGTVVGMIRTFETIASYGAQDPRLLAGGIREALITTEAGLAVAIPLLLLHALLRGRAESLAERLREQGERLIIETTK